MSATQNQQIISAKDVASVDGIIAKLQKQLVTRRANAKVMKAISQSKFNLHTEKTRHLVETIKHFEESKSMLLDY